MAIYHCSTKPLSRSSGRSAVAAAAYRSGDRLVDERQGREHDYTRRSGVVHAELVLPEGAGEWSREELWNAAEQAEQRKDGRTAREWEMALPEELSAGERRELAVTFARELAGAYGCAVDVALHEPDKEGDQRNWHAHLLATTRQVGPDKLGEKCTIEWKDAKLLAEGHVPARKQIEVVRENWANQINQALARAGREETVDHRSLAAQRAAAVERGELEKAQELDREPQAKLGWKVVQMERRGIETDRGNQLRSVQAGNGERQAKVVEIDQARAALMTRQQAEQEAQQRTACQAAQLAPLERELASYERRVGESILSEWRKKASQELPTAADARSWWEKDERDPAAQQWRAAQRYARDVAADLARREQWIARWHQEHRVASWGLQHGIGRVPDRLAALHADRDQWAAAAERNQQQMAALEQTWEQKRPLYEQRIERARAEILACREKVATVEAHPAQVETMLARGERAFQQRVQQRREQDKQERARNQERDRDQGGWSR